MKNIFSQTKDYVKQPKRNVFDLTFHNHGTYNFGYLYPVFCKETIPGDSFMIDPTFALRFLPTAFPVQTKVTANLHFFYVRNRNLWDNWKKFITHTDEVEFPFLSGNQSCMTTNGLADYLGVPTTIVSGASKQNTLPISAFSSQNDDYMFFGHLESDANVFEDTYDDAFAYYNRDNMDQSFAYVGLMPQVSTVYNKPLVFPLVLNGFLEDPDPSSKNKAVLLYFISVADDGERRIRFYIEVDVSFGNNQVFFSPRLDPDFQQYRVNVPDDILYLDSLTDLNAYITNFYNEYKQYTIGLANYPKYSYNLFHAYQSVRPTTKPPYLLSLSVTYDEGFKDLSDVDNVDNPFIASNPNSVRISALPFRAYESIYNAFYRNDQNDPLMINGKPEYDVYVPNRSDGVDNYNYRLYKRNWELDFLTSAVQSPQQGIAPLVGVSQQGDFTFVHKDSDGNVGYFSAKANFGADGNSITGFTLSDKVEINGLPTNPVDGAQVPDDVKRGTVYNLNQMALGGISINDFRNVNSLQRWLETNIRRGYKYRDQIKSHYGVDISENILDMPEFIGGVSRPVMSSQVNQTVETQTDPLGSYAGQLSLITDSPHSIKHYCDEHGFIIGILSITPIPNYSQLLPKHFIKYNYLDYYFPEFAHIGMQPIDYREVCPLQQYAVAPENMSSTFGYQRPWYDYIASVDEVHGLFRTNLRNFVLNRQFSSVPVLNKDFLQIDPEQLNDIFTVQDVSDKIMGQILFNVIVKRPIPRFGIPRLE